MPKRADLIPPVYRPSILVTHVAISIIATVSMETIPYGPRVHDLRHTFAVRSMQKLKKSKSDIVTTLPYLSAYLGHCNMSATQIYLHLTAECYPEFIQKQCDYLGDTIPTWEAPNENC